MKMKRLAAAFLALTVLCAGLGCWAVIGQIQNSRLRARVRELEAMTAGSGFSEEAPELRVENPDAIAAEFDGGVVTAAEAAREYATISAYYQLMGMKEEDYAESAKQTVLDGLVEGKILEIKAREMGVYEFDDAKREEIAARVRQEYEDNVRYYMDFRFDESKSDEEVRAETIEYLDANGYSYEEMLQEAERSAWQDRLFEAVTAQMTIDEAQIRALYQSQLESAELTYGADYNAYETDAEAGRTMVWNPEGVRRVDSIFVPFDEQQSADYLSAQAAVESGDAAGAATLDTLYAALEAKAQIVLDRLNAGESFDALMAEMGTLNEHGHFVSDRSTCWGDDFRSAAMALGQIGAVSGMVRVDGGLCVLRYAADVPAGAVDYEAVKDELRATYEAELKSSQYNATVVQWIQEANVQLHTECF